MYGEMYEYQIRAKTAPKWSSYIPAERSLMFGRHEWRTRRVSPNGIRQASLMR
jgi:hypothetical protein